MKEKQQCIIILGWPLSSLGFPGGTSGQEYTCQSRRLQETQVQSLGWGDPLEEGMVTHPSIFAQRIQWREETGGLQSIESQNRHD